MVTIKGTPLPGSYKRITPKPVDATSVWDTYANAAEYAANNGTDDYCPYAGQLVVTLQGYPNVDANSEKYKSAHVWRLAAGGQDTIVGGLTRKHFVLEEVKTGGEVAGTTVHNTFTGGTQTFAAWIEMLQGMTMGYTLATETDGNGETHVKTDPTTGMPKVKYINGQGQIQERVMNADDERVWVDDEGKGHMVISAIKVLGTLEVTQIDVNHITHSGGLFVNSRANIIVDEVEQLSNGRTKLTFVGTANGQTLFNLFEVGDLALSMTFNVLKEGASTPSEGKVVRVYWREVTAVDDTSITLKAGTSDMATPRKGDTVVHLGHIDAPSGSSASVIAHAKSRQGCQVMGFSDNYGPYFAEYDGINAPSASVNFDRPDDAIVYLSPKYHKLQGDVILLKSGDNYIQLAERLTILAEQINLKASQADLNLANGQIQANANAILLKADQSSLDITNNNVTANANAIALKASQADLDIANGKITANADAIALKASQADLDIANGKIAANANAILLKADQSSLDITNNNVTANANAIALKASQADLDIANGKITANANAITLKTDQTVFEQGMQRIHMGVTNKVRNYVTNPRAIDGTKGTTSTDPFVTTDPEYGSVESIYSTSGGDWQWWHTIDNKYSDLTGGNVTWFCVVKPVNAASGWRINFGSGYQASAPTSHAAVCVRYDTTTGKVNCTTELDTSNYGTNIKTEAIPLANGWYLCYTSAKLKSGVTIIPGQNCVGYNSTYGRWYLYCCGIVKGEGYPSVNLLMEDTNLRDTGIDIEAKKITATADNFVVQNNGNNTTFTIDEYGNIMGAANAMFKGNLCLPYLRLTSSNISSYRVTNFDGQEVVNLSSSGLNLQVEVSGITLRLPQITSSMLGCEVNIFNATTGTIEINGSGRADTVSSGGYFCNLLKPSVSSSLRTNTTITINKFREAKFKAIYNGQGGHENFNYTWLCCYANINP